MSALRTVFISTEDFEAEAIYYGDMPLAEMMTVSAVLNPIDRVKAWVDLMEKAILDPAKAAEFGALPFEAAMIVCALYLKLDPREMFTADSLELS